MTRLAIVWVIIALLLGGVIGFGLHNPIASVLNLNAASPPSGPVVAEPSLRDLHIGAVLGTNGCPYPKAWTGNGCADTNKWNTIDWNYYFQCLNSLKPQPPSAAGAAVCAQQTQQGSPR